MARVLLIGFLFHLTFLAKSPLCASGSNNYRVKLIEIPPKTDKDEDKEKESKEKTNTGTITLSQPFRAKVGDQGRYKQDHDGDLGVITIKKISTKPGDPGWRRLICTFESDKDEGPSGWVQLEFWYDHLLEGVWISDNEKRKGLIEPLDSEDS